MAAERNVFIAQTPFQIFNCCEAIRRFHPRSHNTLLIVDRGEPRNNRQMRAILEHESFPEVVWIPFHRALDKVAYHLTLRKTLTARRTPDHLYVALFRNISAHIINSLSPRRLVIYDDGNRILRVARDLFQGTLIRRNRFRATMARLIGKRLSLDFVKQAEFFSAFDLSAVGVTRWRHNDYRAMRGDACQCERTNTVALIGSRMLDGTISRESFERALEHAARHFRENGLSLEYIPHRYEDPQYLAQLARRFDFSLTQPETIIEYHYLKQRRYPATIATFRSTAATSLARLFDVKVVLFQFPEHHIQPARVEEMRLVYEHFANEGHQIVCVN